MNKLTSIDYANYIRFDALSRHDILLNKTQVNKILFICYGLYLVIKNEKLFDDDTPKAWPYGPVFPRVYKRFGEYTGVDQSVFNDIQSNTDAKQIIEFAVDNYSSWTAYQLSEWSHRSDGPWFKTVYGENEQQTPQWNKEISDKSMKEYFAPQQ